MVDMRRHTDWNQSRFLLKLETCTLILHSKGHQDDEEIKNALRRRRENPFYKGPKDDSEFVRS